MAIQPGDPLLNGKYDVLRLIGEGALCRVWLAEEPSLPRRRPGGVGVPLANEYIQA
jgi:hypothetical protein